MRLKSVVSAKIVQLVSGKIEHSCDNPVFTYYDNIIVSPSSASSLDVHYSTISLGCNMHGMINNVIYDLEWFSKAVTNKTLARVLCQPPALWGRVACAIHGAWFP
jgi:hypothetical protein